jgi:hypothetical protein
MKRPELTYEEFCNYEIQYTFGYRADKYAVRQYLARDLGFGKQDTTPYSEKTGEWGEPVVIYYLTDDERNYDTPDQLYVAYMEKACGMS